VLGLEDSQEYDGSYEEQASLAEARGKALLDLWGAEHPGLTAVVAYECFDDGSHGKEPDVRIDR